MSQSAIQNPSLKPQSASNAYVGAQWLRKTPLKDMNLRRNIKALSLNSALCNWVLDFLTGHPQVVKVGNNTSTSLILNTGIPQGCVLSPLLYSLFTHDCVAMHISDSIIKFADKTTGLITNK
jgi:hypothetical protein